MKRRTPIKRTPLRRVSKKRAKENREYLKLREEFLENRRICECEGCIDRSTQVHHTMGRGKYLCNTFYFMPVCAFHHEYIESHKKWARKIGYILYK